jgi:hypothetical protein
MSIRVLIAVTVTVVACAVALIRAPAGSAESIPFHEYAGTCVDTDYWGTYVKVFPTRIDRSTGAAMTAIDISNGGTSSGPNTSQAIYYRVWAYSVSQAKYLQPSPWKRIINGNIAPVEQYDWNRHGWINALSFASLDYNIGAMEAALRVPSGDSYYVVAQTYWAPPTTEPISSSDPWPTPNGINSYDWMGYCYF